MEEHQHQSILDEEATLVAPRFDDEETLVARPVVPLDADADAPAAPVLVSTAPRPAHEYRSPYAPRRALTLALVLVSVLVGGVLGGAGLYLFQRQSHDPAVSPSAATQQAPAPPAEAQQATPNAEAPSQQTTTPDAAAPSAEESAREEEAAAAPAREPENVTAVERRTEPAEGTPKRGKKGRRDEVLERRPTSQPDGNIARADQPEARKVDTIFGRPRRAERRARRGDDVDRLRRIFEGTP